MTVLVYADHDNEALKAASYNTFTAATFLGDVHVLVAGENCRLVAEKVASVEGVSKVLIVNNPQYTNPLAETVVPLLQSIAREYSHILAPATTVGKNLMPRLAALLDVQQLSDISGIVDDKTFERPIYAGNAIATIQSADAIKVITVRSTAFDAAKVSGENCEIVDIPLAEASDLSTFIGSELTQLDRPELTAAKVIISGGRGMQSGENFEILEKVANVLGAAVGASRAAVDSGFVSNDYQVGQTGKIVAPDLYIAVGISGAIQHLAGMKDSKVIVAINKDEEAPIFQVADYGLVADLFKAVPELEAELQK